MRQLIVGVVMLLFVAAGDVHARIRVSQETSPGSGEFVLKGSIDPFPTDADAATYYAYGSISDSYNGPVPELIANRSHLFFVSASDGLSLFVVHDKKNDGDGGHADMAFSLVGDTATILVEDDPGLGDLYSDTGTMFTTDQNWGECCTDGLAIGSLDGTWTMDVEFTRIEGLDSWGVYDDSGASTSLVLATNQTVRLEPIPIPEPSTLTLLGVGAIAFLTYTFRRKTRRSK